MVVEEESRENSVGLGFDAQVAETLDVLFFGTVARLYRSRDCRTGYTVYVSVTCSQNSHEISRWALSPLPEYRVARDIDDVKHSMFIQLSNEMTRQSLPGKHDTIVLNKEHQRLKG